MENQEKWKDCEQKLSQKVWQELLWRNRSEISEAMNFGFWETEANI